VNEQTRDFVYDLSGRNIDEFTPGGSGWLGTWTRGEAYAGSLHIATYANGTTEFDNSDWLSTFRARSDINGNKVESCTSLPFGEDLTCTGTEVTPIHFTGKEHDAESGNDFFGARYYTSTMGRFLTPDWAAKPVNVPYAHFGNPQSLNLYSYVNNNPTTVGDPDGHIGGVDDAVEVLLLGGTVTVMAMQAYFAMPASQRNLGASFSQAIDSVSSMVKSWSQSSNNSKTGPNQPQSNPWQGNPDDTAHTTHPDGNPKQDRKYGPDGFPQTDVDHDAHGGAPDPHAHDIGRPSDGSAPTDADRGPWRPVQPGDPQPQQQQGQQQLQQQQQQQVQPQPQQQQLQQQPNDISAGGPEDQE
jgi:RHS repeat-associated protein